MNAAAASRAMYGLLAEFDETSALVAAAHELEAWGDARAEDGSAIVQQPLIAPLYDGHTALDVVAVMAEAGGKPARELVRDYWRNAGVAADSDWRRSRRFIKRST